MAEKTLPVGASGNTFIDENHHDLLNHLEILSAVTRDSWESSSFRKAMRGFIADIENHFSHEEVVLAGARYQNLDQHKLKHRVISLKLHLENTKELDRTEALEVVANIRDSIFSHELLEDQDYWDVFEQEISDQSGFVCWLPEYETGNRDVDLHHHALMNHLNRFCIDLAKSADRNLVCRELKLLAAYSEYHFREEEKLLGAGLRPGHAANHNKLIADLGVLTDEVGAGKFELKNLREYLNFWLIAHIQDYDIPAFAND